MAGVSSSWQKMAALSPKDDPRQHKLYCETHSDAGKNMNNDKLMERIRKLLGDLRSGNERRKLSDLNHKGPDRRSGKDRRSRKSFKKSS